MDITVAAACSSDYSDICRLNRDAFGYEYPLEQTRNRLAQIIAKPHNQVFVARQSGRVVGYAHAADYDCTYARPLKNLLAIAVSPDCQGRGVGKKLLAAVEDWARQDGASGVRLVSGFNRQSAHEFYRACGYSDRKDQKNFIKLFCDE